ncbi:hypothetical protein GF337_13840 [candidate division KSB1 bacterium]|nr:hypothetical protein [candidate division KSB1 bacterium]
MINRVFVLIVFIAGMASGQNTALEEYVETGLENNLALKQQEFALDRSMEALKQARGMFLPSVSIDARYSRAGGGRMIDIPIGDLMNPVYSTLNELLASVGREPMFPANISNERIPFLREEEHETKIRLVQPLFQPAVLYNYKLKSSMKNAKQAEIEVFKHELTADIKTAYYNYLKAMQVVGLYGKTKILLEENLRVSKSLFENNKATEDVVFRAEAELAELEQKKLAAEKDQKLAAAYFNFLLNRQFSENIVTVENTRQNFDLSMDLDQLTDLALENRPEFRQLEFAVNAAQNGIRLSKTSFVPNVVGVVDYGFQGEKYRFTEEDDFWMASAVLNWNLFNGGQDKAKYQQAVLQKKELETRLHELRQQVKLGVQQAYDEVTVAAKSLVSTEKRVTSARKSFNIVNKKYKQGMAPHIEYLNSRTTLTNAEIAHIIARFDYQIKIAELERAAAL